MPRESVLFGIAGVFFGVLVGWIIGSQQVSPARPAPAAPADAQTAQAQPQPPPLDESRVTALKASADSNPKDSAPRVELGNLYFDHERFREAVQWYEDALRIDPRNVDVSTDLGIAYYYMNQPDAALEQFNRSLRIEPSHTKTLLNIGIVRAFGKQDLEGAAKAWQRVVDIAPTSPEADRARQALAGLRSAHPETGGGGAQAPTPPPKGRAAGAPAPTPPRKRRAAGAPAPTPPRKRRAAGAPAPTPPRKRRAAGAPGRPQDKPE